MESSIAPPLDGSDREGLNNLQLPQPVAPSPQAGPVKPVLNQDGEFNSEAKLGLMGPVHKVVVAFPEP
jgi:hypothetical protein